MINRCVCYEKTFSELLAESQKNGWTAEQIREIVGCGSACGMCFPYIKEVLETKKTEFPINYRPKP